MPFFRWLKRSVERVNSRLTGDVRVAFAHVITTFRFLWRVVDNVNNVAAKHIAILHAGSSVFTGACEALARQTFLTLRHLKNRHIPRALRRQRDAIMRTVRRLIAAERRARGRALRVLGRVLRAATAVVRALVKALTSWARAAVGALRTGLSKLRHALRFVLNGPGVLARWLLATLLAELWRYVLRNDRRIFRWARDRSLAFTLMAAGRVETLIRRLL